MESLSRDLLHSLDNSTSNKNVTTGHNSVHDLDHDLNKDEAARLAVNQAEPTLIADAHLDITSTHGQKDSVCLAGVGSISKSQQTQERPSLLPSEVLLCVLENLTVDQLLPCQLVSHQFRAIARTIMLDKLGAQFLLQQQWHRRWRQWQQRQHARLAMLEQQLQRRRPLPSLEQHLEQQLKEQAQSSRQKPDCPICAKMEERQNRSSSGSNSGFTNSDLPPLPHSHHASHQQHAFHSLHHGSFTNLNTSPAIDLPANDLSTTQESSFPLHYLGQPQPSSPQSTLSQPPPLSPPPPPPLARALSSSSSVPYHRDAGYVAPGTLALFLFPHHDHTPTGWQDRQSVHFQCTGIDRDREQLIFSPISTIVWPSSPTPPSPPSPAARMAAEGDCLKFSTNSWNVPSASLYYGSSAAANSAFGTTWSNSSQKGTSTSPPSHGLDKKASGDQPGRIGSNEEKNMSSTKESRHTKPGLNLFDYSTGRARNMASSQHSSSGGSSHHRGALYQERSSSRMTDAPTVPTRGPSPFRSWSTVNSNGGEHYSVIGVKYGDWTEGRAPVRPRPETTVTTASGAAAAAASLAVPTTTERENGDLWWGCSGLYSSPTQESMVHLPWPGQEPVCHYDINDPSHSATLLPNEDLWRISEHRRRLLLQEGHEHEHEHRDGYCFEHDTVAQQSDDSSTQKVTQREWCTCTHSHRMSLSNHRLNGGNGVLGRGPNTPEHHHRYLCLHHDQLMADLAALSSLVSESPGHLDHDSLMKEARAELKKKLSTTTTVGSRHLSVEYTAQVSESKRCLFCLNSPCRANLEIQVRFSHVRVSLDWLLSGFAPELDLDLDRLSEKLSELEPSQQRRGSGIVPS